MLHEVVVAVLRTTVTIADAPDTLCRKQRRYPKKGDTSWQSATLTPSPRTPSIVPEKPSGTAVPMTTLEQSR